jgi:uncharacterized repeat protein (TIGR01451 family)
MRRFITTMLPVILFGALALGAGIGSGTRAMVPAVSTLPAGEGAASPTLSREWLRPDNPDTIRFGFYTLQGGLPYAVPGEVWTFDHGAADPLEGWTATDLSNIASPPFRNVTTASWAGHGNQTHCPEINPAGTAWLGYFENEANDACFASGLGYGNLWAQRYTSPLIAIPGSGDLTVRFKFFANLEPGFDVVRVKLIFPDGGEVTLGEEIDGVWGLPDTLSWADAYHVAVASQLGSHTQCQLRFELASDVSGSDEDGLYPTDYGPFGFGRITVERDGVLLAQSFDRTLLMDPQRAIDGGAALASMGQAVCMLDVDSDGYDDAIVGVPGYGNGESQEGRVLCFHGGPTGISSTPSWSFESNAVGARLGSSIAGAIMNYGTPYPTIMVGAPGYSNGQNGEGRVYIFGTSIGVGLDAGPTVAYESNLAMARLGWSVACGSIGGGDFYFFAGAPYYSNGQSNEGRLYAWVTQDILGAPTWTRESNQVDCYLGTRLLVVADDNNGGYLTVGLPWYDDAPGVDCGAIEIRSGFNGNVARRLLGNQPGSQFGMSIAPIGDFNGDGGTDLAVAASMYATAPAVILCTARGTGALDFYTYAESPGFSTEIAPVGMVGNDVTGDIVMGGGGATRARILDLNAFQYPIWRDAWAVRVPSSSTGMAMAGTGDVNADGNKDLLIGFPGYTGSGPATQGRFELRLSGDTDDEGWATSQPPPIGAQAGIAPVGSYGLPPGACGMQQNVLELHDAGFTHPDGQHTLLVSPIVDLTSISDDHDIHRARWDTFLDQVPESGVFFRCGWIYYPWTCPITGAIGWSPREAVASSWMTGAYQCWSPYFTAGSYGIPPIPSSAEQLRFYVELFSSCEEFGIPSWECTGNPNLSPLLDNIVLEAINGGSIAGVVQRATDCQGQAAGVANVSLSLSPGGQTARTDDRGRFAFYNLTPGQYTVTVTPPTNWTYVCGPVLVNYTGSPVRGLRYAITPTPGVTDLAVTVAAGQAKPGFATSFGIICSNLASTTASAPLTFHLPAAVSFLEATPVGIYHPEDHTVRWSSVQVPGTQSSGFLVRGSVSAQANLGDELVSTVEYGPPAGDAHPENNSASCVQTVVGALDPNDKHVSPEGSVPVSQTLSYQINFQNVGTAEATNVRIEDPIDADLDLASLTFGASSHVPTSLYVSGQTAIWEFSGINLPDSTSNEPGSHGFVTFQARPRSGLPSGQEITNSARIYFDFSQPVTTNTVSTSIVGAGSVEADPLAAGTFSLGSIGPVPARGTVRMRFHVPSQGNLSVEIYDAAGRRVRTLTEGPARPGEFPLEWDARNDAGHSVGAGIYFLRSIWAGGGASSRTDARIVLVE